MYLDTSIPLLEMYPKEIFERKTKICIYQKIKLRKFVKILFVTLELWKLLT